IERNKLANVSVHPYALGEHDGSIQFYGPRDWNLTMSTLRERTNGPESTVECRRLSPFIIEPVDLLKIDIEGAEQQVLSELARSGKLRLVEQIHLEYHHHIAAKPDSMSRTLKVLEDAGFGYQLKAHSSQWPTSHFQDISIYCYRNR